MIGYRPFGWLQSGSSSEYIAHIAAELERLQLSRGQLPSPMRVAWHELVQGPSQRSRALGWDNVRLEATVLEGRKPKATVLHEITSHNNLSIKWQPDSIVPDTGDWKRHPIHSGYAGFRPESELYFVRDARRLIFMVSEDWGQGRDWGLDPQGISLLAGDLLSAIKAGIRETLAQYEGFVEWRLMNELKLETRPKYVVSVNEEVTVVVDAKVTEPEFPEPAWFG